MATKTEIRNTVLRRVGVIEAGGTPSADEITDTETAFDETYSWLVTKNAVTWDSDEDVPDAASYHFQNILIARIGDEYLPANEYQLAQVRAYGDLAERGVGGALGELIDQAKKAYVPTPVEADYF